METTVVYWGSIGIMEKKMETLPIGIIGLYRVILGLHWGSIGIMEKNMETTI